MSAGDRDLEASVRVEAAPEAVWDLVADVTRMGEWSPECRRCLWVGRPRGPVAGAKFIGVNKRGLVVWATRNVVVEAERGEVFSFRTREAAATWTYRVAPEGTGTRLTETRTVGTVPKVAQAVVRVAMGGERAHDAELARGMERTLERLKAVAEAAAAPVP